MRTFVLPLALALAMAAGLRVLVQAQDRSDQVVGRNINIVTGSADQFIGDMFRQRQNEPVFGVSSINPAHMMSAYNDYRTVDFATEPTDVPPSPTPTTLVAKVLDFLRL